MDTYRVRTDSGQLRIRAGPGLNYAVVGSLVPGSQVQISEERSGWCRLHGSAQNGWVSKEFLDRVSIGLPGGDPVAAIRQDPNYVERRVKGAGIFGLGGPFRLDQEIDPQTGQGKRSFFMERSKFSIDRDPFVGSAQLALTSTVYTSEAAATAAVNSSPYRRPGFVVYTHYRGHENIIFPTIISTTTAPALIRALNLALQSEREYAKAAQGTLIEAFVTLGGLRYAPRVRAPAAAASELSALRETTRVLVREVRRNSGRVVVNLAGTGEVEGAINLNNLTGQQVRNIPNLVRAGAEQVGHIFDAGAVDSIVSNDVVFGQLNWVTTARGCFTVLRSGGKISIAPYVGQLAEHLQAISGALRDAGFRDVVVEAGRFVTALKP